MLDQKKVVWMEFIYVTYTNSHTHYLFTFYFVKEVKFKMIISSPKLNVNTGLLWKNY